MEFNHVQEGIVAFGKGKGVGQGRNHVGEVGMHLEGVEGRQGMEEVGKRAFLLGQVFWWW